MRWAWMQRGISSSRKLVLLYIAWVSDENGLTIPSVAEIRRATGLSAKTTMCALRDLESLGLIKRPERQPSDPTSYRNKGRWQRLRSKVLMRDNYTCVYCGKASANLHCDHVLPRSRGGPDSMENLVAACPRCNLLKGAKTPEEWGSNALV